MTRGELAARWHALEWLWLGVARDVTSDDARRLAWGVSLLCLQRAGALGVLACEASTEEAYRDLAFRFAPTYAGNLPSRVFHAVACTALVASEDLATQADDPASNPS